MKKWIVMGLCLHVALEWARHGAGYLLLWHGLCLPLLLALAIIGPIYWDERREA